MLNEKTRNEFPRYVPLWRNPRFTSFTTGHSITMDSLEEKAESGHVRICTCVYVYNPRFSDTPLPPPLFFKNEIVIWFCLRSKYMHINFELNVAFVWIRWSIKLNIYITGTHCFLYMQPHQDQEWRGLHVLFFNRELDLDIYTRSGFSTVFNPLKLSEEITYLTTLHEKKGSIYINYYQNQSLQTRYMLLFLSIYFKIKRYDKF